MPAGCGLYVGPVLEDLGYGNAMYWSAPDAPSHALWDAITMPALVLCARVNATKINSTPAARSTECSP